MKDSPSVFFHTPIVFFRSDTRDYALKQIEGKLDNEQYDKPFLFIGAGLSTSACREISVCQKYLKRN
jgi:hypothetical protein